MTGSPWLRRLGRTEPDAQPGVVFFPPAGASASAGWALATGLAGTRAVLGVQYPGRGPRLREPHARSVRAMATATAAALAPDAHAVVLFGHSFGALLAYEVARTLEGMALPVAGLVVCGGSAPGRGDLPTHPEDLSDTALLAFLGSRGGTRPDLLADDDLMRLTLPALRADLAAGGTYVDTHAERTRTPVVAIGGAADPVVPAARLASWEAVTDTWWGTEVVDGDHFSFLTDAAALAAVLDRHWPTREGGEHEPRGPSATTPEARRPVQTTRFPRGE
ncbi:thioesterase II family protein [Saccharothrix sp. Mg75]|uniref:thioesterase II family protein n=1 Tax=Saccharothrix sp. Mg75 TaxID=3445357 RepID=UPI003EEEEF16